MTGADHIKLIACDIDGTLVVDGRVVSPELRNIFTGLRQRGVEVALCTGRMPHWTEAVADELGVTEYLICTEGGHVLHRPTRNRIHYARLDTSVLDAVGCLMQDSPEMSVAALCDDLICATTGEAARRAHWWGFRSMPMADVRTAVEPVALVPFGPHRIVEGARTSLCESLAGKRVFVHDIEDQGSYAHFKICSPEADKGVGAERLVRHLGGDMSHVLAFGDYLNDLSLLRSAGCSICPREAHPLVRQISAHVSSYSAAEGFVARELCRIFRLDLFRE